MRRTFLPVTVAVLALAALALESPRAAAARPVHVYEVTVRGVDTQAAAGEAMRQALVRATGRADAATDPALSTLVANAARYVRSVRPLTGGVLQVTLDGDAVEREILASGHSVWDPSRPFTIVVLSPQVSGAAADSVRRTLDELGEARGLPVSLVPMAQSDATGAEVSNETLLQNAQRLGGDALLIGHSDSAGTSWQWTLLTGFATESWNGSFEAGVNGAVDAFVRVQGAAPASSEGDAVVEVMGITTLSDYAAVERIFSVLPGIKSSGLEEANGASATYRLVIRGGADAVRRALTESTRLTAVGASGGHLLYQLHP